MSTSPLTSRSPVRHQPSTDAASDTSSSTTGASSSSTSIDTISRLAKNGTLDATTATRLVLMVLAQRKHEQSTPKMDYPENEKQAAPIRTVIQAIGQQAIGKQLLQALAGRDITVHVIDDATYAKLAKQGHDQPNSIAIPEGALSDPALLSQVVVVGLEHELKGMKPKSK